MISPETFEKIVRGVGTPVYVYDHGKFLGQVNNLRHACPNALILYAVKANSNPVILRELKIADVAGVDAVSAGEIILALNVGFQPKQILFTGNNISDAEISFAVTRGVVLNIDSLSCLERVGKKYPGLQVCIRINSDVGASHHNHCITGGPDSKFGIWHTQVPEILKIAGQHNLRIVGLHQHIGSQILDPEKFMLAMEALLKIAAKFPRLNFIDFGGGLGVPYKPKEKPLNVEILGRKMSKRFEQFCQEYGQPLQMIIEPGRYLVAEAGYFLVTVTTVKRNPNGKTFVGVDSGFNHLDRPARYGAYHHITNLSNPKGPMEKVTVVGNICESGDKFATDREINQPREGDLLLIHTAGAYGFSMASNYNSRPRPAEVLVYTDKTSWEIIRRRETTEEVISRGVPATD